MANQEANGEPGRVLVSEAAAERLADRYEFGPAHMFDLKGKGPARDRFLPARRLEAPAATASSLIIGQLERGHEGNQ